MPAPHARRPLLALAVFLAAGAWLGVELPKGEALVAAALAGIALLLAALRGEGGPALAGLFAAAFAVGAVGRAGERELYDASPLRELVVREAPEAPLWIEGRAFQDSRRTGERVQLFVEVLKVRWRGDGRPRPGRARISVPDPSGTLEVGAGERLALWATLRAPRGYATPGAFDVAADARRRGIHAHGYCKSVSLIARLPGQQAGGLTETVAAWRRSARQAIHSALPPGDEEGLVRAMVLGDRAGLSSDASEAFRIAGTYHVLALSGAQVALVAGLVLLAVRRLRLAPFAGALVVGAAVGLYALFVGADAPVMRAAVMAACLALGKALDLDADAANLLGLAGGALLVLSPAAIGDASFQLSFAATLGILLMAPPLAGVLPSLPLHVERVFAVSIAAQAALLPLLAWHFHRLAPAALALNLVAGPLSAAVMLSGFALLLAHALAPALLGFAADVAWSFAHALLRSCDGVEELPWLDARVPTPAPVAVLAYLLALGLLLRGRRAAGAMALVVSVLAIVGGPGVRADGRLRLSVLDVGQGEALVLRSPSGRVLLVDAGPASLGFDVGEAVVAPYLWSLGLRRVEGLFLTHADGDHIGGGAFVARAFSVRDVYEGVAAVRDPRYQRLARWAAERRRLSLRAGARLAWDGVQIDVLGPRPPARAPATAGNEQSLVLRLRYRAVSLLLMGDAPRAVEEQLELPRADVLKVAHHGSRTGTGPALLERARPRLAVVSVGSASPYGHPHPEVLERLLRAGARVFRTDRDGTLEVASDGVRVWLFGALGGAAESR